MFHSKQSAFIRSFPRERNPGPLASEPAGSGSPLSRDERSEMHCCDLIAPPTRPPMNKSALHRRATALSERPKRLVRRDGGAQLVIAPRAFRFRGLLHLEQIHRVDLA